MRTMDVFYGTVAHATDQNPLEIMEDTFIGVEDGKISFMKPGSSFNSIEDEYGINRSEIKELTRGQFLMPGFIDTHVHAPQYPNSGLGLDLPLLKWLEKYTFPLEEKYADANFADKAYSQAIKQTLRNGTTMASYFATIHLAASLQLAEIVGDLGQRAYIGKVNMDSNCPETYREKTEESVKDTEMFVTAVLDKQNPLITPVITPRFPPATSSSLMSVLGHIAKEHKLPIQSHIAENREEVRWVRTLFPDNHSYADIFRSYGLLSHKTVLAHGIYLTNDELDILRENGTSIAHCPNSNISIFSGLLDARRVLDSGVKLGLGTDVAGGYSPSILNAQRMAVQTSTILRMEKGAKYASLDYREAFRLATLGGAKALGLENVIGNFEVGKDFDALLVDTCGPLSPFDVFSDHSTSEIVEKFLHLGDDRNFSKIYVAGKCVMSGGKTQTNANAH